MLYVSLDILVEKPLGPFASQWRFVRLLCEIHWWLKNVVRIPWGSFSGSVYANASNKCTCWHIQHSLCMQGKSPHMLDTPEPSFQIDEKSTKFHVLALLTLCMGKPKWVNLQWSAFHQGLHCFFKVKKIFRQENTIVFESYNLPPLDKWNGPSQVYWFKSEVRVL